MDRIEYSITDKCNLNCAYCCHYAPVVNEYQVSSIVFADDMHQLAMLSDAGRLLGTLGIVGGEPLMHPEFIDLCIIAREYLPMSRIRVTTNGTLINRLTKQELCILRRYDIEILVSKYLENFDYDKLDSLLSEYGVIHKFCQNGEFVTFSKYAIDETGSQNPDETHKKCTLWQEKPYYTCHELRNGYLYPCSQIARAGKLNELYNLKLPTDLGISIYSNNWNQLEDYVKAPCEMCKYCKVDEWNKPVGKWKPSTKSKEEFV